MTSVPGPDTAADAAPSEHAEPPAAALLTRLGEVLRAAFPGAGALAAEWSQASTEHAGRAYVDGRRASLPFEAGALFARLREAMAAPGHGAWFSARVTVPDAGPATLDENWSERPYWNSTTDSMLDAPADPPVPDERRWLADLTRHPRDRANAPAWLPGVVPGEEFARLREHLDAEGLPRAAVRLPGEDGPAFEGVLELLRHSQHHYELRITDFGDVQLLAEVAAEADAARWAWGFLHQPLPVPMAMTAAEAWARAQAAEPAYTQLRTRLANVGPGGLTTTLALGVPFDHVGGPDGLYLYAFGTSVEERSLPPTALADGAATHVYVARGPVTVRAEVIPAWFGHPGGGLRFRLADPGAHLRALVASGHLAAVALT